MKKRLTIIMAILALLTGMFIMSCSDDDSVSPDTKFEILQDYMEDNGMDFASLMDSWIIAPDALNAALNDYYILDLRGSGDYLPANGQADYVDGHIPGAVPTTYADVLTAAANNTTGKPIVVVCWSGQSAAHAVMALRMSGYSDAKSLKWGMSGWHSDFDMWSGNTAQLNHANWIAAPGNAEVPTETYDDPKIETESTDGADILAERVNAIMAGFKGIVATDVLDTPANYFINNYWSDQNVTDYGNIDGAVRINPIELKYLDPDQTIVTYCWTGQTSSMITAYLTAMGYDAKSLRYGANGMIYDDLTSGKWTGPMDYDYAAGMNAEALVTYMDSNGLALTELLTNWKISASALSELLNDGDTTNDPYVMETRSAELWEKAHIPGSHNVALADLITHADANITDKNTQIAVCCYTGQSAAHGVVALRLAGYPNVYSVGYGFSGWHTDIDGNNDGDLDDDVDLKINFFTGGTGNHENTVPGAWIAAPGDAVMPTQTYDLPTTSFEGDSAADILKARGQYVVENFHKVSAYKGDGSGALENVDNPDWFINHFWSKCAAYGNMKNSYNIYPAADYDIHLLDPSKKIVNSCWTGQSASILTAYLTVLGYDAWSLGNGANSIVFDAMTDPNIDSATGWGAYEVVDLPIEGTLAK